MEVEVEGFGCRVRGGILKAAYSAEHGKDGREWIDGRVGGEE